MFELANLEAGHWDEAEARAYVQLAQWAAQRLRSISAESVGAVYACSEERFSDSYLFIPGLFPHTHTARDEALGLSQPSATFGLARLRDRELGLVEDLGERRARVRAVYQVVGQGGRPGSTPATHPRGVAVPRDPPHLPAVLKGETPTTRLVYLYLEPHGEVEVSVRRLEELLGIAHRNAAEALQKLVEVGLLEVLEPATSRPGRYRVKGSN